MKNNYDNDEECCTELVFNDLKKETIYGDNEEATEKLNEGTLFENIDNKKRHYDDIYEEKIDGTKKIKRLLNEEYFLKNDDDNDEKCCTELDFKDLKNETIYGKNEDIIEQLNKEDLFNITNRRLIKMITNKMKNEENEKALYKIIGRKNILETFVSQILKYFMDSIPDLLENKDECYAVQTRSKLKNSRNINMDENEDNIKNKLLRNVEALNKVQKKRGRPRKIIQEIKLQEPIKKRGRPRKVMNKSHENDKKRKFMESEDESDSDLDYDVKQKPKENNKKKHFKENKGEELKEEIQSESNSDLSSEDEKEEET